MFDSPRSPVADRDLALVLDWMSEHGEALACAAERLGGGAAADRLRRLQERLPRSSRLSPRDRRDLSALHDLLLLKHVGDPERIETSLFAGLDPASREVEDLCLLADDFGRLLERLSRTSERGRSAAQVPCPAV